MRLGRVISFLGSLAALAVMTVISVAIGVVCARVPDALKSSIPVRRPGRAGLGWRGLA
jgi:hypothetical protein